MTWFLLLLCLYFLLILPSRQDQAVPSCTYAKEPEQQLLVSRNTVTILVFSLNTCLDAQVPQNKPFHRRGFLLKETSDVFFQIFKCHGEEGLERRGGKQYLHLWHLLTHALPPSVLKSPFTTLRLPVACPVPLGEKSLKRTCQWFEGITDTLQNQQQSF